MIAILFGVKISTSIKSSSSLDVDWKPIIGAAVEAIVGGRQILLDGFERATELISGPSWFWTILVYILGFASPFLCVFGIMAINAYFFPLGVNKTEVPKDTQNELELIETSNMDASLNQCNPNHYHWSEMS